MSKKQTDVKVFVPEQHTVKTLSGESTKIPKISWKKELKILDIIQSSLDSFSEILNRKQSQKVKDKDGTEQEVSIPDPPSPTELVSFALRAVPDQVTKVMGIVMDRDDGWVQENLDSAEILGVIVPLLRSRLDLIRDRIAPYTQELLGDQSTPSVTNSSEVTKTIQ